MYIVYLDESGTHTQARYFVLAGLAVFERETYFLAQSLDQLQSRYFPSETNPIEFHASSLRAPDERILPPFDKLTKEQRWTLIRDIYEVIAGSRIRLFGVAIEKASVDGDPYERAFEEIVNRFDRMLASIYRDSGDPQRGLVVIAESSYRENLEILASRIWSQGHRWGELHNMADIPYFAPAKSTRLLQLADFAANAIYGRYESGFAKDFDKIATRIHQEEGRLHGLVHRARDREGCYCPACVARRALHRPEEDS
ncbi:MAG: DUF3800 domain-containing protein [Dehalococcoidia bacterium]|nr:DUF3800 domain-containing protein [Dehalococcoidia bacterium]